MARHETQWQNHLTRLGGIWFGRNGPHRASSNQTVATQTHANRPSISGHTYALAQVPGELDTLQTRRQSGPGQERSERSQGSDRCHSERRTKSPERHLSLTSSAACRHRCALSQKLFTKRWITTVNYRANRRELSRIPPSNQCSILNDSACVYEHAVYNGFSFCCMSCDEASVCAIAQQCASFSDPGTENQS